MLKGNLSTRPFYNERLVSLVLALIAVAGLGLAAYNATELRALSARRGELKAASDAATSEATAFNERADAVRTSLNASRLSALTVSTHEANQLIDQRTFSWTAFFDYVEKTIPMDAYLVDVAPRLEKGTFLVRMTIVSKSLDQIEAFGDALEKTGAFYDVLPTTWRPNDDGTLTSVMETAYLPATTPAPKAEPLKPGDTVPDNGSGGSGKDGR
jgi:hypothetical protein